jgi:predicted Ser/Thr protein kinase
MANQVPKPADGETSGLSSWTASQNPEEAERIDSSLEFTPGTMLAGRYRVVALLGRGGMGQVYRAEDTKLGQAVALKFLHGTLSPERRHRLYAEVRIGREVSHPSVCRLYDIVEVDGLTFIAMEYVDGEDLRSLLSRIGRLPPDKALEIGRDLASGLAAVHEKGVVHRDLKPANVMIDGRGRARLTDFGLAVATEVSAGEAFAGTPAYMSPEQLSGGEVTARSDIYALGLILSEMLCGRPFFDARSIPELVNQHRQAKRQRLSSSSGHMDPIVERLVLQCLEEDPAARPASARLVAASLPGGDPLEMAVAAGETPSPEMVAAANRAGDLSPAVGWGLLLLTVLGMGLLAFLVNQRSLNGTATLPKPPAALVERARELLSQLGRTEPGDSAWSFERDRAYLADLRQDPSPDRWERARTGPLGPFEFFYRESPVALVAAGSDAMVSRDDPPLTVSEMTEVILSGRGELIRYVAVPPELEVVKDARGSPDWSPLFAAAGLDPRSLRTVEPRWAAPVDTDHKEAWEGAYPGEPGLPIRVEAAAYRGRPVWFSVLLPWSKPGRMAASTKLRDTVPVGEMSALVLALGLPIGGVLLARRNLRLGRGDRSGAVRVAVFVFVAYSIARLFRASHVSVFRDELWILIRVFAYPAFWAMAVWLVYIALEPYARRRWPHVLIAWKRLLGGQLRDPLVGREILLGAAAGSASAVVFELTRRAPAWLGEAPLQPQPYLHGATLTSFHDVGFRLFVNGFSSVLYAMMFLFLLVLMRLLLRSNLLAAVPWCLVLGAPLLGEHLAIEWTGGLVHAVLLFVVLTRGGLLAFATSLYFLYCLQEAPLSVDPSAWVFAQVIPFVLVLGGLAVYGFHTSLGGQALLGRALLEDEPIA